jgi:SAM-dependent methyltransferase
MLAPFRYSWNEISAYAARVLMEDPSPMTRGSFLNLGAGTDIRRNMLNFDCVKLPGIDKVGDVTKGLPFPNETFDGVIAYHVLEHIPHHTDNGKDGFIFVMEELHRVLKPGGWLIVRIPNGHSRFGDPTHYRVLTKETFLFFTENHIRNYLSPIRFDILFKFDRFELRWFAYHVRKLTGLHRMPRLGPFVIPYESEIFMVKK